MVIVVVLGVFIFIFNKFNTNDSENYTDKSEDMTEEKYTYTKNKEDVNKEIFYEALEKANDNDHYEANKMFLELEKSIDEDDSLYNDVVCNIAITYYKMNEYSDAINYFERYEVGDNIILNKYLTDMYLSSLHFSEQYDKCIDIGNEFLNTYTDNEMQIMLRDNLFNAYISKEEYENALKINDELLELDEDNIQHYIGRAYLYQYMYSHEESIDYLKGLKERFPNKEELNRFINNRE